MLRTILLSTAAALVAVPALAADLPSRTAAPAAPYVAPAAPIFTWTGFYLGVNAGYNWGNNDLTLFTAPAYAPYLPRQIKGDTGGFTGGVQAGYNWQINQFVLGVEGDWVWLDSGKNNGGTTVFAGGYPGAVSAATITSNGRIGADWLATLRGRIGYAMDRWMVYGTGGFAWGSVKSSSALSASYISTTTGLSTVDLWSGSNNDTRFGWAIGGGVEYAFTNNITTKIEYLYYDLGSKNYAVVGGTLPATSARAKIDGSIVRAGLNYKF